MPALSDTIGRFTTYVINPALILLAAAGFFFFVFGLVEFMLKLSQGGDAKEGKQHMLWGVVGMVIMFSVYGIISLINSTFSLNAFGTPNTSAMDNINPPTTFLGK